MITQLESLKTGKAAETSQKRTIRPPPRGASPKIPLKTQQQIDFDNLSAFPVAETTDNQGKIWQQHSNFDFHFIKEVKTAVSQYGATAPYTTAIIESIANKWLIPSDWYTLTRATLAGGDYLLRKSEFAEACK